MAITKRFKVTFEVTTIIDSEAEKNLSESVLRIAQMVSKGEKVDSFKLGFLEAALTGGPDEAAAYCIRHGLRSMVKEAHDDLSFNEKKLMRFSPAIVRVTK
ncbi:host HNS inhibition [Klebsiella phage VLCpiA3d]|nr:host HNS inhibition [Klebsiella phage VLCpiA3d]